MNKQAIKYLPLGDSYTIGELVKEEERWPNILVENLKLNGINIEIICNPSVTGYTTQNLIDNELPIFIDKKPNFCTLLIGVNDWVQEVDINIYRNNLIYIIDKVLEILPSKERLILVTIPDFGKTPEGNKYSKGRDISEGILEFNEVIKNIALSRNIAIADIFEVSQKAENDINYVAEDGLHPSYLQYKEWEKLVFPLAIKTLK